MPRTKNDSSAKSSTKVTKSTTASQKGITKFPSLYKTGANGKELVWKIWVEGDTIKTTYGQVEGKMTDPELNAKQCKATNVGRANERNPEEQALFTAESSWKKKMDGGYLPKSEEGIRMMEKALENKKEHGSNARGGKKRDNEDVGVVDELPKHHDTAIMKGPPYKGQDVSPGGYAQPKYDGIRCKASRMGDVGVMTTSSGNQFVHLKHIKSSLAYVLQMWHDATGEDLLLDGECYVHDLEGYSKSDKFRMISAACRSVASNPHKLEEKMEYHVFDIHGPGTQKERLEKLREFFKLVPEKFPIKMAPSYFVKSQEKLDKFLALFEGRGYEGLIFRYKDGEYDTHTKYVKTCFKYKNMQDEEYKVIDAKEGTGREKGKVIWVCKTKDGNEFTARQDGDTETCKNYYKNRKKYIGKPLTIRFQDKFKNGIPRFPVAKGFRDYE